jgi:hypothetical protein
MARRSGYADLPLHGGRGNASRRKPAELRRVGDLTGTDGARLADTSRLVAKSESEPPERVRDPSPKGL